ncbi:hypothetical protein Droror1_Dr00008944 [Drosera rotundifolia]
MFSAHFYGTTTPTPMAATTAAKARTIGSKFGSTRLTRLLTQSANPVSPFPSITQIRTIETLAFEEIRSPPTNGSASKPYNYSSVLFLHGLLGTGRNWRSFAKSLSDYLSRNNKSISSREWRMVLVDLRNHGRSAGIKEIGPPHDIYNAAKDLADLVRWNGWEWPDVVIGHSMGGKVGLQFVKSCVGGEYGEKVRLPKQLWVLDSIAGPVHPDNRDGEVEKVLQTLWSLPSHIPSRKWLVDHMMQLGFSKSLSEWIGSNLKKSGDHQSFSFNLEAAIQMFNSYKETDYWSLLEHPPKGTEISMVRAENSDRWHPETVRKLEQLASREHDAYEGKMSLHVLPNAGHWVHVDNPKGLLDILAPRIASLH